jgi:hypothetical protein
MRAAFISRARAIWLFSAILGSIGRLYVRKMRVHADVRLRCSSIAKKRARCEVAKFQRRSSTVFDWKSLRKSWHVFLFSFISSSFFLPSINFTTPRVFKDWHIRLNYAINLSQPNLVTAKMYYSNCLSVSVTWHICFILIKNFFFNYQYWWMKIHTFSAEIVLQLSV